MNILIDCFKQIKGTGKSIGIYNVACAVTQNLAKKKENGFSEELKKSKIIVLGNKENSQDFNVKGVDFIEIREYDPTNKIHCVWWELFGITKYIKKTKADKVIFPRGYRALQNKCEDIVIIHDLIPFYYNFNYKGTFGTLENFYIMNRLKSSAKKSKKVITISEASKKDIIKYCGVNENKVKVIYNGCSILQYSEKKQKREPYICAITSNLPHKNAHGILESYKVYFKNSSKPVDLFLIGIDESSLGCIFEEEIKKHIHCYKYLKDNNDLYRIISNSEIFLFLSLVEGFGLPPIEAMQLEVPVICSNRSSLPEIVGNSAILVDPENPVEVAKEIDRLMNNKKLQKNLIEKGKKNLQRFSWDKQTDLYWQELLK
ncbi:glycosyltransferase family 1 protein [Erysipelotrichaceae bacterium 66-17]